MLEVSLPSQNDLDKLELNRSIRFLLQMSKVELIWLDFQLQLEKLNTLSGTASKSEKEIIKTVLQTILCTKAPWTTSVLYINKELAHLVYSPHEIETRKLSEKKMNANEKKIRDEVKQGVDPWLARIRYNERNVLNPFLIGFYQLPEGKITPIFGPRHFKSKRQVENSFLASRSEDKEVNLLTGDFIQVEAKEMLSTEYWQLLPDDLRQHFDNGEILVTAGQDLFEFDAQEISQLTHAQESFSVSELIDSKIVSQAFSAKYYLLYYSDYGGNDTGRTGVITQIVDGALEPLLVSVNDKEFVIEVKGCGTKTGGFGKMQFRTGRDILTGGAEAVQARDEFRRLQDDKSDDSPKAVGSILFNNNGYEQGYIIRLTPSTVRAAYTGSEVYPNIEASEVVRKIISRFSTMLAEHIFLKPYKILDRSSHTENMVIWGEGRFTFTDYSDHVVFADNSFPHYDNHGGYMTPKAMLRYFIEMVNEVPGFQQKDMVYFLESLRSAFLLHGVNLEFNDNDDEKKVIEEIWESCMAFQVYLGRKEGNYFPEGVLNEIDEKISSSFSQNVLSLESELDFVHKESKNRVEISKVVVIFEKNLSEVVSNDTILQLKDLIKKGQLSELLMGVGRISIIFFANQDLFSDDERRFIYSVTSYYSHLESLSSLIQKYFTHELEVVSSARKNCPDNMLLELSEAEEELEVKIAQFWHILNTDFVQFYKIMHDPLQLKKLLAHSFYGN